MLPWFQEKKAQHEKGHMPELAYFGSANDNSILSPYIAPPDHCSVIRGGQSGSSAFFLFHPYPDIIFLSVWELTTPKNNLKARFLV